MTRCPYIVRNIFHACYVLVESSSKNIGQQARTSIVYITPKCSLRFIFGVGLPDNMSRGYVQSSALRLICFYCTSLIIITFFHYLLISFWIFTSFTTAFKLMTRVLFTNRKNKLHQRETRGNMKQ